MEAPQKANNDSTASAANAPGVKAAGTSAAASFTRLYEVITRLRGPGGCPWDIEQTPTSLRGDLLEEAYECVEAINEGDSAHIAEELGDVFLLATMLSYMHEQDGAFTVSDALEGVADKLIRRHPHVFGDTQVANVGEVLDNWAKIKVEQEGRAPKTSLLDEVSRALPPLERAYKLQKKAAKAGFDWPSIDGVLDKLHEELGEVAEARAALPLAAEGPARDKAQEDLEGELGDLLFAVVNLCRFCKVDPAVALQGTNARFTSRFAHVEREMKKSGIPMDKTVLDTMEAHWQEAKKLERGE